MQRSNKSYYVSFLCILFAVGLCCAQSTALSGKVVNARGIGLANVSVKLANAKTAVTTDVRGNFTFASTIVATTPGSIPQPHLDFHGKTVGVYLTSASDVRIDLFTLQGRCIPLVEKRNFAQGKHTVFIDKYPNAGMFLARVRINNVERVVPLFSAAPNLNVVFESKEPVSGLYRSHAAVDTLIVGKLHYSEQHIPLDSYTSAQNVTLVFAPPATARAVYSEAIATSIGTNAPYTWDNTGTPSTQFNMNYTVDRFEGTKACRVQGGNATWSGWGIASTVAAGADLSRFAGGSLHFAIKGTMTNVGAWVLWKNDVNKTALSVDIANYGYIPGDSLWHEVAIPLNVFGPMDSAHIDYFIALESPFNHGEYIANTWYIVDNIYFAEK